MAEGKQQTNPPEDEEYFRRYMSIYHEIMLAYMDLHSIQALGENNESISQALLLPMARRSLNHINTLLKTDLALTIWKIYIDTNSKANTIQNLYAYLKKRGYVLPSLPKLPKPLQSVKKDIATLRKTYIAHNDIQKYGIAVEIKQIGEMLDEVSNIFNYLNIPEIDGRVASRKISKGSIHTAEFYTKSGLTYIIKKTIKQED